MGATVARDPAFQPANDVERNLLQAAEAGNTDSFLSTLLLATVLLRVPPGVPADARPGDPGSAGGPRPSTAAVRRGLHLARAARDHAGAQAETVSVRFVQLIRHWPDEQWSFAVNPGTPGRREAARRQIVALANWAAEMGLGRRPERAAAEESARPDRPAPRPPAGQRSAGRP